MNRRIILGIVLSLLSASSINSSVPMGATGFACAGSGIGLMFHAIKRVYGKCTSPQQKTKTRIARVKQFARSFVHSVEMRDIAQLLSGSALTLIGMYLMNASRYTNDPEKTKKLSLDKEKNKEKAKEKGKEKEPSVKPPYNFPRPTENDLSSGLKNLKPSDKTRGKDIPSISEVVPDECVEPLPEQSYVSADPTVSTSSQYQGDPRIPIPVIPTPSPTACKMPHITPPTQSHRSSSSSDPRLDNVAEQLKEVTLRKITRKTTSSSPNRKPEFNGFDSPQTRKMFEQAQKKQDQSSSSNSSDSDTEWYDCESPIENDPLIPTGIVIEEDRSSETDTNASSPQRKASPSHSEQYNLVRQAPGTGSLGEQDPSLVSRLSAMRYLLSSMIDDQ